MVAAVCALFALLAWNYRWMAAKVDRSQELLAEAVNKLSEAVDHMRATSSEWDRRHNELLDNFRRLRP